MCRRLEVVARANLLREDVGLPLCVGRPVSSGLEMRASHSLSGIGSLRPPQLGGGRPRFRVRLRPLLSCEMPRV